jgi:hypothetical protein
MSSSSSVDGGGSGRSEMLKKIKIWTKFGGKKNSLYNKLIN